ncbi:hypothetical protein CKA32_005994 [Geitlerinema sp. FC II]|nr:hypothetical protein CKA32_005994 [Geitlerinema sp. FC II]
MTILQADLETVREKLTPLLGKTPRRAILDSDRCFVLVFEANIDRTSPNPSFSCRDEIDRELEEWFLLTDSCYWRVEKNNEIVASCYNKPESLEFLLKDLNRHALISVELFRPLWDTRLTFENNLSVYTFSVMTQEFPHWELYQSDGTQLTIGPGSSWSCTHHDKFSLEDLL